MGDFYCPNLTIIDESEVNLRRTSILGRTTIARVLPAALHAVYYQTIQDAIQEQADIYIELQNISQCSLFFLWQIHKSRDAGEFNASSAVILNLIQRCFRENIMAGLGT